MCSGKRSASGRNTSDAEVQTETSGDMEPEGVTPSGSASATESDEDQLGRLASGIAHEFNNLLTVILSYSDLLLMSLDQPSSEADPEFVREIRQAAMRGTELTEQLHAFGRRQRAHARPVTVAELTADLERRLGKALLGAGKDHHLVCRCLPDQGMVQADTGLLERALLNLVRNAAEAMEDAGIVLVEADSAQLEQPRSGSPDTVPPGHYARISVQDSGRGMDTGTLERAFEPFFTTKGSGRGTGLGLSIVLAAAHASGGAVQASSRPDKGTRVDLYLPYLMSERGTVLMLVEANPHLRESLAEILGEAGYTVIGAGDCAQAEHRGKRLDRLDLLLASPEEARELSPVLRERHTGLSCLLLGGGPVSLKVQERQLLGNPSPAALLQAVEEMTDP